MQEWGSAYTRDGLYASIYGKWPTQYSASHHQHYRMMHNSQTFFVIRRLSQLVLLKP